MKKSIDTILYALDDLLNYKAKKDLYECDMDEWIDVYKLAKAHQLQCVIFDYYNAKWDAAFKKSDLYKIWFKSYMDAIYSYNKLLKPTMNAIKTMQVNGIELIILKGITLRPLYRNPSTRLMCDVDILVKKSTINNIKDILKSIDFVYDNDRDNGCHNIFSAVGAYSIEAHYRLLDESFLDYSWFNEEVWLNKQVFDDGLYQLADEDHLIFLFAHAVKHINSTGLGLRQMFDISLLIRTKFDSLSLKSVYSKLERLGILKQSVYLIEVCNKHMNLGIQHTFPIDNIRVEELFKLLLRSGAYGNDGDFGLEAVYFRNAKFSGLKQKNRDIFGILFPSLKKMKKSYNYLDHKPYLLPGAWVKRIIIQRKHLKNLSNKFLSEKVNYENVESRLELVKFLESGF